MRRVDAYFATIRDQPHLGLWTEPHPDDAYPVDMTALAVRLHRDNAEYIRERIAVLRSGNRREWLNEKYPPLRPYIVDERAALEWLARLTELTEAEQARLDELSGKTDGDARPVGEVASLLGGGREETERLTRVARRYGVAAQAVADRAAKASELCLKGERVEQKPREAVRFAAASLQFVDEATRDETAARLLPLDEAFVSYVTMGCPT